MSRALAVADRIPLDAYYTPDLLAEKLVGLLQLRELGDGFKFGNTPMTILEPHVGGGSFARAIKKFTNGELIVNDINPLAPGLLEVEEENRTIGSFLDYPIRETGIEWIIGNPPFQGFEQHVLKAREISCNVAFLLRLAVLESKSRYQFWQENKPANIYVLSERPSFTGGGTDSAAYGFFVWHSLPTNPDYVDRTETTLEVISWK